jgi:hypothetical protein
MVFERNTALRIACISINDALQICVSLGIASRVWEGLQNADGFIG